MNPAPGRLKALFAEATELPPSQRQEFLQRRCEGDTTLQTRLEALLAAQDELGTYLAHPTLGNPTRTQATNSEPVGSTIGAYKLLERIGEGGFGIVYAAQQSTPVRRIVALKIIKPGMDTRQVIARFEQERQALAMMDHPNIAKVFDAGATSAGRPYFVMELVRGIPITQYCDENRLTPRERLELFIPVCHAVQHAHQKGIIHRDIKPANVLVTLHDGRPVPKVIDFGIAKATSAPLVNMTVYTEFRQFIGTPEYTSPEQAEMSGLDIDTRSDIYSLGVLLYELLTGGTPLDRSMFREAALGEICRIIRDVDPPRPSTRLQTRKQTLATIAAQRRTEPARLPRIIRGDLDWIVMRCLEKDRTRRYDSAGNLALDIQRFLVHEPVSAGPPTVVYRLRKLIRRHRSAFAVIAGGIFLLLAAVLGTSWQAYRATMAEREQRRLAREANAAREGETLSRRRAEERAEAAEQAAYRNAITAAEALILDGQGSAAWPVLEVVPPGRRGWEWRHLCAASAMNAKSFRVSLPDGTVPPYQLSSDGRLAVVDLSVHHVRCMSIANGEVLTTFALPPEAEKVVLNGLISHAWVKTTQSWRLVNLRTGERLWEGENLVGQPFFSPGNGTTFALRMQPARVVTIDMNGGTPREQALPQAEALLRDSDQREPLVMADHGSVILLPGYYAIAIDATTGNRLWYTLDHILCVSPNTQQLFCKNNSKLMIRDARSGKVLGESISPTRLGAEAAFSPDGDIVYVNDNEGAIVALNVPTLDTAFALPSMPPVKTLGLSPNGETLIVSATDGMVRTISALGSSRPRLGTSDENSITQCVSSDGSLLVSGEWGLLRAFDTNTGRILWVRYPQHWFVLAAAFSPDNRIVACQGEDNHILLLDAATGNTRGTLTFDSDGETYVAALRFSPDGKTLGVGLGDGTLRLLSVEDGTPLETIFAPAAPNDAPGSVRFIIFTQDGKNIVTASTSRVAQDTNTRTYTSAVVRLWNVDSPSTQSWEFTSYARAVAVHGDHLVIGSESGADLYSLSTGKLTANLMQGPPNCMAVTFIDEGKRVAVGCDDGTVRLWPIDDPSVSLRDAAGGMSPIAILHCGRGDIVRAIGATNSGAALVGACLGSAIFRFETGPPAPETLRERELLRRSYRVISAYATQPETAVERISADADLPADVRRNSAALAPLALYRPRNWINETILAIRRWYDNSLPLTRPMEQQLRLIEIAEAAYPDDPACTALRGDLLCALQRYAEACDVFESAAERLRAAGQEPSALMLASWAGALGRIGRPDEAVPLLEAAREIAKKDGLAEWPWCRAVLSWAEEGLRSANAKSAP